MVYMSGPCLNTIRNAAAESIAAGHCVGLRLLRQLFLVELESRFGEAIVTAVHTIAAAASRPAAGHLRLC
jgi:hypothetical protein